MNNGSKTNPIVVGRIMTDPVFSCRGQDKITTFKVADDERGIITARNIVARGKQASICKRYLHIGDLCCIEGRYNSMGDSIIINRVTFLCNSKYRG